MRVEKITVKNFKGIAEAEIPLTAPINFFIGPNEAGKTSLRDAIKWALTGHTRDQKTHDQQADLIKEGEKFCEVTLTLDQEREISRRKTPKSRAAVVGEKWITLDGLAGIMADPFNFLELSEAQRREILFDRIPGLNPSKSDIKTRLQEGIKLAGVGLIPDYLPALDRLCTLALESFKTAENEAVARRREAKRLKESYQGVEKPETRLRIEVPPLQFCEYHLNDVNPDKVAKGLQELRDQRDALIREEGRLQKDQDLLPSYEKRLAELKENPVQETNPLTISKLAQETATLEKAANDLRAKLPAEPETYPEICPAIKRTQNPCPRAGVKINLPGELSPEDVSILKKDIGEKEAELFKKKNLLEALQEQNRKHEMYHLQVEDLEEKIQALKETPPANDTQSEKQNLDAQIELGNRLLKALHEYELNNKHYQDAQEKLSQVENEITFYDTLQKLLSPEGIPSGLIVEALAPINAFLGEAAHWLFPGRELELNHRLEITLTGSPLRSKSGDFRVGLAFQYALARLGGSRIWLIDEADILDEPNRVLLTNFLLQVKDYFDRIFLFATGTPRKTGIPEIQLWGVSAGGVITPL